MKIAMIMAGNEEGGLEKHVVELSNGLQKRDYQVSLIAHEKYRDRVDTHFISLDLTKSRRNLLMLYRLYRTLKTLQPDIIHVHGNKAAAIVGSILKFLNIPSVATLHSRKKNTKMFSPFDAVIAVSPNAAEVVAHPNKFVVLNGIEKPQLSENNKKIHPKVVLAVGRLVPVKGFDLLIQAWKGIEDAQLWIVGEGSEKNKLENLIAENDLQDKVKLLGFRNDITDLMQIASLFVMSSHYEGCPYTMIESLLCRLPMVSTAVGAMVTMLPKKYLCEVNDIHSLHMLLVHTLNNLEKTLEDFEPVFNNANQFLVIDGMIDQIEAVYQRAVDRHA